MKRVFSTPPQTEVKSDPVENKEPAAPLPPPSAPRPSVYVRQVTDQHQNAIARILARVRTHSQSKEE